MASGLQGAGLATPLPIVGLSSEAGAILFAEAGLDLETLRGVATAERNTLEGITMNVSAPFEVSEHTPPNVVGMVRGSDPQLRNEYIVYSAHFDHIGVGIPDASGDSIYTERTTTHQVPRSCWKTAAAFAALDVPPARSVIFLAVSGEEKGLLGIKAFLGKPDRPHRRDHPEHQRGHGGTEPPRTR